MIGYLPDFLVLGCIYCLFLHPRWKREGSDILLVKTLMYLHFALVLYVTLMPLIPMLPYLRERPYIPMNTEPFIDVRLRRGDYLRQIRLNVLMLMPYGFLRPLGQKRPLFIGTAVCTFLYSLMIELMQPFAGRTGDVTDLITNTAGGAAGYVLSAMLRPLTGALLQKINKERDFR